MKFKERLLQGTLIKRYKRFFVDINYNKKTDVLNTSGVVIGYDSRHRSFEFAQMSSQVLAAHGIPVFLFRNIVPTPLVGNFILSKWQIDT